MENITDKCQSKLGLPTAAEFSSSAALTKNGGCQSFYVTLGFLYEFVVYSTYSCKRSDNSQEVLKFQSVIS